MSTEVHPADMDAANELAEKIAMLANEYDIATALTAIGMVLGSAVLVFGSADKFFPALQQHAENVAASTRRRQAMLAFQCEGSA